MRSTPYFSSAWNVDSGSALVTRDPPRTWSSASSSAAGGRARGGAAGSATPGPPAGPARPAGARSRRTRRRGRWPAPGPRPAGPGRRAVPSCGDATTVAPLADGSARAAVRTAACRAGRSTPTASSSAAAMPSPCSSRASSRCTGSTWGCRAAAGALRRAERLLALVVNWMSMHQIATSLCAVRCGVRSSGQRVRVRVRTRPRSGAQTDQRGAPCGRRARGSAVARAGAQPLDLAARARACAGCRPG